MQFSADSKCQDRHIYRKAKYTKWQGWNTGNDDPPDVKEHTAASARGKKNISHYSTELLTKDTLANRLLAQAISSILVKISVFLTSVREHLSWDMRIPQLSWPLLKSIKISQEITVEHLTDFFTPTVLWQKALSEICLRLGWVSQLLPSAVSSRSCLFWATWPWMLVARWSSLWRPWFIYSRQEPCTLCPLLPT